MHIRAYLEPICERIGVDLGVYVWQRICIRITAYMYYVLYYRQGLSADISQYIQSLRAYIHYRAILYRACGLYSIQSLRAYILYKLHCDLAGLELGGFKKKGHSVIYIEWPRMTCAPSRPRAGLELGAHVILLYCIFFYIAYYIITLWPCRPRAWRTCHSSVLYILLYCILYRCLRACIKYYTYYMERILPCRPRVWRIKKEKKSVKKKGSQLSHIIQIT
jgi:hypothetical protein